MEVDRAEVEAEGCSSRLKGWWRWMLRGCSLSLRGCSLGLRGGVGG